MDNINYLNLITSEYRDKPNFIAWVTANLNIADGGVEVAESFNNEFDLDLATGNQLDILGDILGQARTVRFDVQNVCEGNVTLIFCLALKSASVSAVSPKTAATSFITLIHPAVGVFIVVSVPIGAAIAPKVSHIADTCKVPLYPIVVVAGKSQM